MRMIILIPAFLVSTTPAFAVQPQDPGAEGPPQISVDCDKGQSVQDALDRVKGPSTILVGGTCTEHVLITKDDVTLQGGTYLGTDPNRSTIVVQGARRVVITGVTVSGKRNGVVAFQGGWLTLENCTIQNNSRAGVAAFIGSSAIVDACVIQNNAREGVVATDASTLVLTNSMVENNGRDGVFVGRGSNASIGIDAFSVAGPNTIRGNNGRGILVYQSSQARIHGNLIETHPLSGVHVEGSTATITANTIRGGRYGVGVWNGGSARIGLTDAQTAAGNLIEQNFLDGVQLTASSSAWMYGNTIQYNGATGNWGILASENSVIRMVGRNIVRSNGGIRDGGIIDGGGVLVHDSSTLTSLKGDFSITPNNSDVSNNSGMAGILAVDNSVVDLRDGMTVTSNSGPGIYLIHGSRLRIQETTVSGNTANAIQLTYASSARFRTPPSTIGGAIVCADGESSVVGIPLPPGCTGF